MPRYYRRNYYRRPGRRVSRFNRYTRRFNRNMLATTQQRDAGRFTIKVRRSLQIPVAAGSLYGCTAFAVWDVLGSDPQFMALKTLFDQVKINGVRISATSRVQPGFTTTLLPTYVYAWDRNGADELPDESGYNSIASYGSSRLRPLAPGTRNSFVTSLVAQDVQERCIYIPTEWAAGAHAGNPAPDELYFKPTFLIGVKQPASVQEVYTYEWELDVAVDITFRGTKYTNAI